MDPIEQLVRQSTGRAPRSRHALAGGSIHRAEVIELDDGQRVFAKSHPSPPAGMFAREAEGLAALAAASRIRVPAVVAMDERALVLEFVESHSPPPGFFAEFGRQLARLHRDTAGPRFGFDRDNYIGATPQPNGWAEDWVEFWRQHRLGFQLDLAQRRQVATPELLKLGERLMADLEAHIAEPAEPACLLHGDLWSGNFLCDSDGHPVLIDPAAYCGRREAELAMTQLFGGFPAVFYRAYEEVWPLAPGAESRLALYRLYHLLNHLNLFGHGYLGECLATLRTLVAAQNS